MVLVFLLWFIFWVLYKIKKKKNVQDFTLLKTTNFITISLFGFLISFLPSLLVNRNKSDKTNKIVILII